MYKAVHLAWTSLSWDLEKIPEPLGIYMEVLAKCTALSIWQGVGTGKMQGGPCQIHGLVRLARSRDLENIKSPNKVRSMAKCTNKPANWTIRPPVDERLNCAFSLRFSRKSCAASGPSPGTRPGASREEKCPLSDRPGRLFLAPPERGRPLGWPGWTGEPGAGLTWESCQVYRDPAKGTTRQMDALP